MSERYTSFRDFYAFYLGEHSDVRCRALHYGGSTLVLGTLGYAAYSGQASLAALVPLLGYGPAWVGHLLFEKNRPATFRYPLWSLIADFVMLGEAVTGRLDHGHFRTRHKQE
jgi:hypothetical protein